MSRQQRIEKFFRYARARHQVYLNRTAGKAREDWTKDPILKQYRFTNVFRELDKTTAWFRKYVRDPMREDPRVLLATVVFRLLNRIEVGEAVFCQQDIEYASAFEAFEQTGNVRHLRKAIRANCGDGPYVTGAYIISSPAGYSKLDGVLEVIRRFDKNSEWRHWVDNDSAANETSPTSASSTLAASVPSRPPDALRTSSSAETTSKAPHRSHFRPTAS